MKYKSWIALLRSTLNYSPASTFLNPYVYVKRVIDTAQKSFLYTT
jgi:hypothetical protein